MLLVNNLKGEFQFYLNRSETGTVGINSCGRSKHSDYSLFWARLSRGAKINDTYFHS